MADHTQGTVDVDLQLGGMLEFQETAVCIPNTSLLHQKNGAADGERASPEIKKRDCSI